jgi:hypothetical protein
MREAKLPYAIAARLSPEDLGAPGAGFAVELLQHRAVAEHPAAVEKPLLEIRFLPQECTNYFAKAGYVLPNREPLQDRPGQHARSLAR